MSRQSSALLRRFYASLPSAHEAGNDGVGYDLVALQQMTPDNFDDALSAVWERDWGPNWRTIEVLEIAGHKLQFRDRALAMLTTLTQSTDGDLQQLALQALFRLRRRRKDEL